MELDGMIEVSATIGQKALELYETGCVRIGDTDPETAVVKGTTGWHLVRATADGPVCDCRAWSRTRLCSHAASAMLAWRERLAAGDGGAIVGSDAAIDDAAPPVGLPPDVPVNPTGGET